MDPKWDPDGVREPLVCSGPTLQQRLDCSVNQAEREDLYILLVLTIILAIIIVSSTSYKSIPNSIAMSTIAAASSHLHAS